MPQEVLRKMQEGRWRWPLALFLVGLAYGTVAYIVLDREPPQEAFTKALAVILTLGDYSMMRGSPARAFVTASLTLLGMGVILLYFQGMMQNLLEEGVGKMVKHRLKSAQVRRLSNHIIVCGFGRVGRALVKELLRQTNYRIVVIDKEPSALELIDHPRVFPVVADLTAEDDILDRVGIKRAKYLFATLGEDSDNLFVVLSAKEKNPDILIIARANTEDGARHLKAAGAKYVVMPAAEGGRKMARFVE